MNIENIKCFISLAECLNFTKAAEKEHVTQTAMSRKINSLEGELGIPLFYRDNRVVELTPAGREFYERAKKLLLFYDQAVYTVQNIQKGFIKELKIGVGLYEDRLLSPFIGLFTAQHPQARISCMQLRYHNLMEQFREDLLDVIISSDQYLNELPHNELESYLVHDKPWNLAIHRNDPLADSPRVSAAQLKDHVLVTMYDGSVSTVWDHYRNVFPFRDFIYVNSFATKLMMVRANLGVGMIPSFLSLPAEPNICLRPLEPAYLPRKFYVLCKKSHPSQLVHQFARQCAAAIQAQEWPV